MALTSIEDVRSCAITVKRQMSPAALSVLIHCHALVSPLPESMVHDQILKWFLDEGIIEKEPPDFHGCGYVTTERGKKWLDMILATPMPIKRWIDPREDKPVEA